MLHLPLDHYSSIISLKIFTAVFALWSGWFYWWTTPRCITWTTRNWVVELAALLTIVTADIASKFRKFSGHDITYLKLLTRLLWGCWWVTDHGQSSPFASCKEQQDVSWMSMLKYSYAKQFNLEQCSADEIRIAQEADLWQLPCWVHQLQLQM